MGMPPHWTPTEYAAKLRSGLARAKEQIRILRRVERWT